MKADAINIRECRAYRYSLPLQNPLRLKHVVLEERAGYVLQIIDQDGLVGWGDVAPLPEFSLERPDQAAQQCVNIVANVAQWGRFASGSHFLGRLYPSVQFGIDCALAHIRAQREQRSVASLWSDAAHSSIRVNALLRADDEACVTQAREYVAAGYRAIKIKVGQRPVEADAECVAAVRDAVPENVSIRLDANRSWELDDAIAFARHIAEIDIEYVEEPLRRVVQLPDLAAQTEMPVALDETLADHDIPHPLGTENIVALVLKPTLIGGIEQVRLWSEIATRREKTLVFSSAFESGLGIWFLSHIAAAYGRPEVACGLDTGRTFLRDIVSPTPIVVDGCLAVDPTPAGAFSVIREELFELDAIRQAE